MNECIKGDLKCNEKGAYSCLMVSVLCQKVFDRESKTRAGKER